MRLAAAMLALAGSAASASEQQPAEPTTRLAMVEFSERDGSDAPQPHERCIDHEFSSDGCYEWRTTRLLRGRVVYVFGERPSRLVNRFHPVEFSGAPVQRGRYLVRYSEVRDGYEGQLLAMAPDIESRWCLDAEALGTEASAFDGERCITTGEVASRIREGQREAERTSPYSLIGGKLLTQDYLGICDQPDFCWNSLIEGRLRVERTFAGNPVTGVVTVRYWAHALYVGQPVVAGFFRPVEGGRFYSPGRTWGPENGRVCLSENLFYPTKDGMRIPREAIRTIDGEVCFRVG